MIIDMPKLERILKSFIAETGGMCGSTSACIGVVDGKQIQLHVVEDEHDFMTPSDLFRCIRNDGK